MAFSLAELMIAIVILGIGLLGVAMMFPVAWTKAREIAEVTDAANCTDAAISTVPLLTQLSKDLGGPVGLEPGDRPSSFLGDVGAVPNSLDPWVHALNLGNFLASGPPVTEPLDAPIIGDFNPANYVGGLGTIGLGYPEPDPNPEFNVNGGIFPFDNGTNHIRPINVAFHERVYPPLPPPPSVAGGDSPQVINHWSQLIFRRQYAWGVLHKQNFTDPTRAPTVADARTMTFYLVTLRRGDPTARYARQLLDDPAAPTTVPPRRPFIPPDGMPDGLPTAIVDPLSALDVTEDVIFPVPWRIQIDILDGTNPEAAVVRDLLITNVPGTPAKARVLAKLSGTVGVAQMLPVGAFMIDELNGLVYRVANREFALTGPEKDTGALITLEEAIPPDQLNDSVLYNMDHGAFTTPAIDRRELFRTVWVYPPPVERDSAGNILGFDNHQPVVNIELRTITMTP